MSFEQLTLIVEKAHKTNDQELCVFEKQLEVILLTFIKACFRMLWVSCKATYLINLLS